jgi:anti-sigma regulatory factor (Ser/Thr protein kinase)
MQLSHTYLNIARLSLLSVTRDFKQLIIPLTLELANNELEFKLEFILEELITNSFEHLLPNSSPIAITFILDSSKHSIVYQEIGAADFDFAAAVSDGILKQHLGDALTPGGLGLALIKQISRDISYCYDSVNQRRVYSIIF